MPLSRLPGAVLRALTMVTTLFLLLSWPADSDGPAHARHGTVRPAGFVIPGPGLRTVASAAVFGDSSSIPCASGTTDLGVYDGYHGGNKVRIRLCAVNNLPGTRSESVPSNPYYIRNANRHAIVNSRVSGAVQTMVRDMKAAGMSPTAFSSYRSMKHQQDLCAADPACRGHSYRYLAEPGTSNHQMGLAVDFTMPLVKSTGASCAAPARAPNNTVWKWLKANAGRYGFKQYKAEPWHWEAAGANSC